MDGREIQSSIGGASQQKKAKRTRHRRRPIPEDLKGELMRDQRGTTAAAVKNMSEDERLMVLLRRQMRNRESAIRSLKRRRELSIQVERFVDDSLTRIRRILERHDALLREGNSLTNLYSDSLPALHLTRHSAQHM
ncbi:hypothetical protein NDN08_002851 [Rhodosorus marinus]|uniref:BZIP domain-containing protein n=1 Tax=Rhodosorus marinus TaxID=101924 RepID=A0AAV8UXK4_9RHOD|nr:hypothetical protein NDN08_002851 [Rhodosorus marinus]